MDHQPESAPLEQHRHRAAPKLNTALQLYLQRGQVLPLWADHAKIEHDEEAYLHCWSVVGYVLGIHRDLLIDTMAQGA